MIDIFNTDKIVSDGRRVQEFFNSELGKIMLERRREEKRAIIERFQSKPFSEYTMEQIQDIYMQLNIIDKAVEWMNDMLLAAEAILTERG